MVQMSRPQIIIVMGVTGVGKSTFIQYATGCSVKVGHGQFPCTANVELYQIPGTEVYLMDTPGFDDTLISDANILERIATSLLDAFSDRAEIKGALYIHPVTEAKMRGSGMKNLIMFKNMLGMKKMTNCRLVTTKWALQDETVSQAREQELCEKKEFWQPLLAAGASTVRFGDSMQSAIEIIKPLVHGPAFQPLLVKEVVEDKKTLKQTQAGIVVADDIGEVKKACEAEIADYKAQETKARLERDAEWEAVLRKERKNQEAKLLQAQADAKLLDTKPVPSSGRLSRWIARGVAVVVGGLATAASGGFLALPAALLYGLTEAGAQVHKAENSSSD